MQLSLQNFPTLVQNAAAAVQAAVRQFVDLTIGSAQLAILEASAAQALWLQWLILQVQSMTRLATSNGADVDSWVGDFGLTRLPAVASSGAVTLARAYAGAQALIVPGTNIKTSDGTQTFTITTDTTNAAWNATLNGYVLPIGALSVTVPVQDQTAGSIGNIQAGSLSVLATAIPNIDTATNALAFSNGIDAETDIALKARFINYINSLSKTTLAAIQSAIAGVQQGLTYAIAVNVNEVGAYDPGHFVVTIDDGTGNPPASLKTAVQVAIQNVVALGETFSVQSPTIVSVTVSMLLSVAPGVNKTLLLGPVGAAVTSYINTLPIGVTLAYSRLAQLAYDAAPAGQITNVSSIMINGGIADIVPGVSGVVKATSVAVS